MVAAAEKQMFNILNRYIDTTNKYSNQDIANLELKDIDKCLRINKKFKDSYEIILKQVGENKPIRVYYRNTISLFIKTIKVRIKSVKYMISFLEGETIELDVSYFKQLNSDAQRLENKLAKCLKKV